VGALTDVRSCLQKRKNNWGFEEISEGKNNWTPECQGVKIICYNKYGWPEWSPDEENQARRNAEIGELRAKKKCVQTDQLGCQLEKYSAKHKWKGRPKRYRKSYQPISWPKRIELCCLLLNENEFGEIQIRSTRQKNRKTEQPEHKIHDESWQVIWGEDRPPRRVRDECWMTHDMDWYYLWTLCCLWGIYISLIWL